MEMLGLLVTLYGAVPTLAGFYKGEISFDSMVTALLGALIMYLRYDTSVAIERIDLNATIKNLKK